MTAPARGSWRSAALVSLWALVAATFALTGYGMWRTQPLTEFSVLGALRLLLAGVVLVWWTQVFTRYTLSQDVPEGDGVLRALRVAFPWLTALRLSLWFLEALALLSGAAPQANPVALTALATIELGFIASKNAVYGTLARWASSPAEPLGRVRLGQWLNAAAALSLGIGVINVVPVAGLNSHVTLADQLVYGAHAALDVLATVLALRALQVAPQERA